MYNALKVPITIYECTAKKLRIFYARVLIEIDITRELQHHVRIRDYDGSLLVQKVVYEWLPKYCGKCRIIGHICNDTRKSFEGKHIEAYNRGDGVWIPKRRPVEIENSFLSVNGKFKKIKGPAKPQNPSLPKKPAIPK